MKKRNIFAVLVLSVVTLGIYDLFWLVKTKKVLNKETSVHTPTVWLLFAPILVFIVAIFLALALGTTSTAGSNSNAAGGIFIILIDVVAFVAIVPITFYWFFKFSKAISEYTQGDLNTGVTFLLLWILHFIGVMIVQDKFNDMLDSQASVVGNGVPGATTTQQPPYPPAPVGVGVHSPQFTAPQPPVQPAQVGPTPVSPAAPSGNIDGVQPPQPTGTSTDPQTPTPPQA